MKFNCSINELNLVVQNHASLKYYNKECDRYYTFVRALIPQNLQLLDQNLQPYNDYKQIIEQQNFVKQLKGQTPNYTSVDFYAKIYQNGLFSQYLNHLKTNSSIQMCGPSSTGLRLTNIFLEQNPNIVCLSGGTAITLFLDLVYYVYASCHNDFEQSEVPYHINLTLFAAFKSEDEAIGLQFLQSAAKNASERFKLQLYFSRKETQLEKQNSRKFSSNFIKSVVKEVNTVDRWYFEGPASFELDIQNALERLGVEDKIIQT